MNSYQKLKAENNRLKGYIEQLIFNPDGAEATHIRFNYKLVRDTERVLMEGEVTNVGSSTNGIISKIKQQQ